jgi:hypothetical protein
MWKRLCVIKKLSMTLLSIIILILILKTEALYAHTYDELTTKVDCTSSDGFGLMY